MTVVTAPGNLLLLGEYAVLEPGGLGVAVAVERRAVARLTGAPRLEIAGRWGGGRSVWPDPAGRSPGHPVEPPSLARSAVEAAARLRGIQVEEVMRLPLHIDVDSLALSDAGGRKAGLGSSAAAVVAIAHALLLDLGGALPPSDDPAARLAEARLERTFEAALRAHRAFQGGRGSGYDVAASVYGGVGRFEGGTAPGFRRVELPWLPELAVFHGEHPVRTPHAVERYRSWKERHPGDARRFLEESNRCVEGFLSSGSWEQAEQWLLEARAAGLELGASIGVPADIEPPTGFSGRTVKALGAGNELGLLFLAPGRAEGESLRLSVARTGVEALGGDSPGGSL